MFDTIRMNLWMWKQQREAKRLFKRGAKPRKPLNVQSCSLYLRGDQIYVISRGSAEPGPWPSRDASPMFKIDRSAPPTELGDTVNEALAASQQPLEGRELEPKAELKFMGLRSWAALYREARLIHADIEDGALTLTLCEPSVGGGYHAGSWEPVKCSREPAALGAAVLAAFDQIPPPLGARKDIRVAKVKTKWAGGLNWLAIRTDNEESVVTALANNGIKVAICTETQANPASSVGVFSPMPGWTLAIGGGVLPDTEKDSLVPFLKAVSIPLGEVYWFANYRIVDYHAWAKVVNGDIVRGYAYLGESGEVSLNEGALTPEEEALGAEALEFPDDTVVFSLAKAWSVDSAIVIEAVS